jgi:hypothetical protein
LFEREKMRGEWRKLHSEERHDLFFSTHVMRVNKSRRMRMAKLIVSIICGRRGFVGKT